jgi:hypothetical protein
LAAASASRRELLKTAPDARHPLGALRDPGTIRARCAAVLRSVEANVSEHFLLNRNRLPEVAERVAALTLRRRTTAAGATSRPAAWTASRCWMSAWPRAARKTPHVRASTSRW